MVAVAIEVCVSIEKVRRLSVIGESRKSPWLVTVLGASAGRLTPDPPAGPSGTKSRIGGSELLDEGKGGVASTGQRAGLIDVTYASPTATAPVGPPAIGGGVGVDRLAGYRLIAWLLRLLPEWGFNRL